jgi:N-hydroxyarylamine O-acetyltransferase
MSVAAFLLDDYLERIHFAGALRPDEETLAAIQRAQLTTIPFENFDILLGRGISLEPGAICAKLLGARRGGYCFELNSLFRMALAAIGFDARPLLASVHTRGQPTRRTHELVLVSIGDRQWIADVGFGGPGLRASIPFEFDVSRNQDGTCHRLLEAGALGTMLQAEVDGQWRDLYSFDLNPVSALDIARANQFTSVNANSHFTFLRVAALHTLGGRVTLLNNSLRLVEGGTEQTIVLIEGQPYLEALAQYLGIDLDVSYTELPPLARA